MIPDDCYEVTEWEKPLNYEGQANLVIINICGLNKKKLKYCNNYIITNYLSMKEVVENNGKLQLVKNQKIKNSKIIIQDLLTNHYKSKMFYKEGDITKYAKVNSVHILNQKTQTWEKLSAYL